MSTKVQHNGAVQLGGCQSTCGPLGPAECTVSTNACQTLQATQSFSRAIASPGAFVDLLAGTGIVTVKFLQLRVSGGTLEVRFTSPFGADQILPVSDLLVLSNPIAGSGLTALAVQGTASLEAIIAGDP